jgi:hypothetical protein
VPVDTALTLALLDYRRGDLEPAAVWCQRLLAYPECNPVQIATIHAILAMASWQLKQTTAAETQLAQAREAVQSRFSTGLREGGPDDGFWYEWIIARVLLGEADLLIR